MVKYLPFRMIKIVREKFILMVWNSHTLMEVDIFTGIFVTKAKEGLSYRENASVQKSVCSVFILQYWSKFDEFLRMYKKY